jgi:alkanesulfonate monooxygenase SsuD/methylene tetrahydromethanopterin reductase-like flavin-dependent oxidoreductase (luciferase family)
VKIGIGLPNTMLDVRGPEIPTWAQRAENRGFTSLATIGRIAYANLDEFATLSAAAAVTERIDLFTNVLLAPAYPTALLAKLTASIDRISNGRLVLGIGVGGRPDDFTATGQPFAGRGRRMDEQIETLRRAWAGEAIDPPGTPVTKPVTNGTIPLLVGGEPQHAAKRMVRFGAGYTIGGAPLEMAAGIVEGVRKRFAEEGGEGEPVIVALGYFSLGDEVLETSLQNLRSYYEYAGEWTEGIAQGAARDADEIRRRVEGFTDLGIDQLIFDPTTADPSQVDRLADIVFA